MEGGDLSEVRMHRGPRIRGPQMDFSKWISLRELVRSFLVGVAQLVRAPGCGPGGRGFKSHRSP